MSDDVRPTRGAKKDSGAPAGASPAEASPPEGSPADHPLARLRLNIAHVIQRYFQPLFILTASAALFLFVIIGVGMVTGSTIATMALAASVQVAFGMIIGFVCVYIGLMMTWFGIDASYTFSGSLSAPGVKGEGALKSASPGLLFALGGMVLIAVSLYKPIVYEEKGGAPVSVRDYRRDGGAASDREPPIEPDPAPLPPSGEGGAGAGRR